MATVPDRSEYSFTVSHARICINSCENLYQVLQVTCAASEHDWNRRFVWEYIIVTIVRSYTGKYHEFVAVCIVTSVKKQCQRQQTSGHPAVHGSVAEHWRLKPEVSWVWLSAAASLFTFLHFRLIASKFIHSVQLVILLWCGKLKPSLHTYTN